VDEQLDNLNTVETIEQIRQRRLQELKRGKENLQTWMENGHGQFTEIKGDKEFFDAVKKSQKCAVHFYTKGSKFKDVMNAHFQVMAPAIMSVKFLRIDAESCPYLAEKLHILVMPTVVLVKNQKTEHSIIGFDELGGTTDFRTADLVNVFKQWKMLESGEGSKFADNNRLEENSGDEID